MSGRRKWWPWKPHDVHKRNSLFVLWTCQKYFDVGRKWMKVDIQIVFGTLFRMRLYQSSTHLQTSTVKVRYPKLRETKEVERPQTQLHGPRWAQPSGTAISQALLKKQVFFITWGDPKIYRRWYEEVVSCKWSLKSGNATFHKHDFYTNSISFFVVVSETIVKKSVKHAGLCKSSPTAHNLLTSHQTKQWFRMIWCKTQCIKNTSVSFEDKQYGCFQKTMDGW